MIHSEPVPPVENAEVSVAGFAPGPYRVEYWDTYEGKPVQTLEVRVPEGAARDCVVKFPVAALERDIAVKIVTLR